jgi:erythromycin esterase-like protein
MLPEMCEKHVIALLKELRIKMPSYDHDRETVFSAGQNARVIEEAERYYRQMVRPGPASWNLRDRHMATTLEELMNFHGPDAKAIIWEHNTHIGDARATDMWTRGMTNTGQILKERHGHEGVFAVGFGSFDGTVMAAKTWGGKAEVMEMPSAMHGSWEHLMHESRVGDCIVFMNAEMREKTRDHSLGHRAIGVVYDPDLEKGNYVPSKIAERYNAFIFVDRTKALHPVSIHEDIFRMPDTFPFGI